MNGLGAISDQVCNKWLVSTHLSVNNSPVQLIFNQSVREPCSVNKYWQRGLHHPMQMTPRMPRKFGSSSSSTSPTPLFVITRPMQMTPGVPKQFQPDQVIAGCRVVNSRTYCSYTALRAVAFFSLSSTYFMIFSAQTPSRLHRCHLKYACWPKPLLKTLHSTQF